MNGGLMELNRKWSDFRRTVGREEVDCNQYSTQGGDEGAARQRQAGDMVQLGINDINLNLIKV